MSYLNRISKSRATKIVKEMVDSFDRSKIDIKVKIDICKACIDYCINENRNFLRQSLQVKFVELLFLSGEYTDALSKSNFSIKVK